MTAVITGVGAVSAFGVGSASLFGALAEGRSAIGPIRSFDASTFPTRVAGEVPVQSIDAAWLSARLADSAPAHSGDMSTRGTRLIARLVTSGALRDRKISFGLLAAAEAWHRAGCGDGERDASLVIALGLEQAFLEDFAPIFAADAGARGAHAVDPKRGVLAGPGSTRPGRAGADVAWSGAGSRAGADSTRSDAGRADGGGSRAIRWDAEPGGARPDVRFRSRVDLTARAVIELLGLRGPLVVNASACAAGALAVAQAASLIERGAASVVLCGAADSMVNPLGLGGMCRLGAPSPRNAGDACRPFDRARDGLVIGEGAAMFVVEDEARANARGARILARILGWGSTQDAYRVTAPRPDASAAQRAMERAITRANVAPSAIGYINAHGTGTPLNDPAESKAIHGALGAHAERVAVSSIKGAIGHLMAAAGAIEIAASLLAFERDLLPGTAHHTDRDPECALDVIGPAPRRARVDALLSNSFGFGGQNASVVLGRPA